jgi:signal transduction histidine kinase
MLTKTKHLGLILTLSTGAVFLFYIGDLDWLGSTHDADSFLAGQGYHELCLLLLIGPIVYAAIVFRIRGGIGISIGASLAILPHAFYFTPYPDPFFRLATFAIISILVAGFIGRELNTKEELRREHNRLERFLSQTIETQEMERQYLAHELHDESAQALVDISHEIDELIESKDSVGTENKNRLGKLRHDVETVLEGTRRFIKGLRPPLLEEMGLGPSLRALADELAAEYGIDVKVVIQDRERRISKFQEMILFRIVQEALTNARKHSQATQIWLSLAIVDDRIRLKIKDNGVGFFQASQDKLTAEGKFGLIGMRERVKLSGGSVDMQSKVGKGTAIVVDMPIHGAEQEAGDFHEA